MGERGHFAYCLGLIAAALSVTLAAGAVPITGADLAIVAALAAMGVIEAELARQIERVRWRPDRTAYINITSVWSLPAALLVPPLLISVLAVVLNCHLYFRGWYREKQVPTHRILTASSLVILSGYAVRFALLGMGIDGARGALDAGWAGAGALVAGIGIYWLANAILVIPDLYTSGRSIRDLVAGWPGAELLELATLVLGTLLAVILVTVPGLAGLIIIPAFLLHRAILVEQFESAAQHDAKTGLLSALGWDRMARRALARNDTFGVLMIDLDHFKLINDSYGHLAGDAVLTAVAGAISATVRGQDLVGRFGGEEFVVLLSGVAAPEARDIAERVRAAIARLEIAVAGTTIGRISASIGVAVGSGTALEQLLLAADAAVYRAKSNGRNRIEGD